MDDAPIRILKRGNRADVSAANVRSSSEPAQRQLPGIVVSSDKRLCHIGADEYKENQLGCNPDLEDKTAANSISYSQNSGQSRSEKNIQSLESDLIQDVFEKNLLEISPLNFKSLDSFSNIQSLCNSNYKEKCKQYEENSSENILLDHSKLIDTSIKNKESNSNQDILSTNKKGLSQFCTIQNIPVCSDDKNENINLQKNSYFTKQLSQFDYPVPVTQPYFPKNNQQHSTILSTDKLQQECILNSNTINKPPNHCLPSVLQSVQQSFHQLSSQLFQSPFNCQKDEYGKVNNNSNINKEEVATPMTYKSPIKDQAKTVSDTIQKFIPGTSCWNSQEVSKSEFPEKNWTSVPSNSQNAVEQLHQNLPMLYSSAVSSLPSNGELITSFQSTWMSTPPLTNVQLVMGLSTRNKTASENMPECAQSSDYHADSNNFSVPNSNSKVPSIPNLISAFICERGNDVMNKSAQNVTTATLDKNNEYKVEKPHNFQFENKNRHNNVNFSQNSEKGIRSNNSDYISYIQLPEAEGKQNLTANILSTANNLFEDQMDRNINLNKLTENYNSYKSTPRKRNVASPSFTKQRFMNKTCYTCTNSQGLPNDCSLDNYEKLSANNMFGELLMKACNDLQELTGQMTPPNTIDGLTQYCINLKSILNDLVPCNMIHSYENNLMIHKLILAYLKIITCYINITAICGLDEISHFLLPEFSVYLNEWKILSNNLMNYTLGIITRNSFLSYGNTQLNGQKVIPAELSKSSSNMHIPSYNDTLTPTYNKPPNIYQNCCFNTPASLVQQNSRCLSGNYSNFQNLSSIELFKYNNTTHHTGKCHIYPRNNPQYQRQRMQSFNSQQNVQKKSSTFIKNQDILTNSQPNFVSFNVLASPKVNVDQQSTSSSTDYSKHYSSQVANPGENQNKTNRTLQFVSEHEDNYLANGINHDTVKLKDFGQSVQYNYSQSYRKLSTNDFQILPPHNGKLSAGGKPSDISASKLDKRPSHQDINITDSSMQQIDRVSWFQNMNPNCATCTLPILNTSRVLTPSSVNSHTTKHVGQKNSENVERKMSSESNFVNNKSGNQSLNFQIKPLFVETSKKVFYDENDSSDDQQCKVYMKPGSYKVPKKKPIHTGSNQSLNAISEDTANTLKSIGTYNIEKEKESKNDTSWKAACAAADAFFDNIQKEQLKAHNADIAKAKTDEKTSVEQETSLNSFITTNILNKKSTNDKNVTSEKRKTNSETTDHWLIRTLNNVTHLQNQIESSKKSTQPENTIMSLGSNNNYSSNENPLIGKCSGFGESILVFESLQNTEKESDKHKINQNISIFTTSPAVSDSEENKTENNTNDSTQGNSKWHSSQDRSRLCSSSLHKIRECSQKRKHIENRGNSVERLRTSRLNSWYTSSRRKGLSKIAAVKLEKILNQMWNMEEAQFIKYPITNKEVNDYYKIVKSPMFLQTIAYKLRNRIYQTIEQFVHDVRRIFYNTRLYNGFQENEINERNTSLLCSQFNELLDVNFSGWDFTYISGNPKELTNTLSLKYNGNSTCRRSRQNEKFNPNPRRYSYSRDNWKQFRILKKESDLTNIGEIDALPSTSKL